MWPLHTTEALAPLIVALAHIQVAHFYLPDWWPLHMALAPLSWPLHWPLPQEKCSFSAV